MPRNFFIEWHPNFRHQGSDYQIITVTGQIGRNDDATIAYRNAKVAHSGGFEENTFWEGVLSAVLSAECWVLGAEC